MKLKLSSVSVKLHAIYVGLYIIVIYLKLMLVKHTGKWHPSKCAQKYCWRKNISMNTKKRFAVLPVICVRSCCWFTVELWRDLDWKVWMEELCPCWMFKLCCCSLDENDENFWYCVSEVSCPVTFCVVISACCGANCRVSTWALAT